MIGERLRNLRKWRHLTQVQLAAASGLAQNYISALECGTAKNPSQDTIARLAAALQVPAVELTTPLHPPPQPPDSIHTADIEAPESVPAADRSGHQYKGYRVMAARPEGGTYCAYVAVEVDGQPLPLHYFESRGVEWGFLGAGPEALAFDILTCEYGQTLARNHLHAFAEAVIAGFPAYISQEPGAHLEWALSGTEIREWLLQQDRPNRIHVFIPPDMWQAEAGDLPSTTVFARFLPDRRLVLQVALVLSDGHAQWKVLSTREQELRADPAPWLVWHDVRDVVADEYLLFRN